MVKQPAKEQFRLLKEQIFFWNKSIEAAQEMVKHARLAKNKNIRALKKLERMYPD